MELRNLSPWIGSKHSVLYASGIGFALL